MVRGEICSDLTDCLSVSSLDTWCASYMFFLDSAAFVIPVTIGPHSPHSQLEREVVRFG